ncbi:hypothetical protein NQ315_012791 [Exocentrus adspersus]|uniref:Uncharacterized protein n=1 Tax=Exocentrus adspersus TaxID=1586481 RepID=A0AAV8VBM5_9CUCU|nr:hypothetical protein NQ315_012791 [Exocentrus adspersus]
MAVIVATAVLHNLAIQENEEIPEDWYENEEDNQNEVIINHGDEQHAGQAVRQLLINEYFNNLKSQHFNHFTTYEKTSEIYGHILTVQEKSNNFHNLNYSLALQIKALGVLQNIRKNPVQLQLGHHYHPVNSGLLFQVEEWQIVLPYTKVFNLAAIIRKVIEGFHPFFPNNRPARLRDLPISLFCS